MFIRQAGINNYLKLTFFFSCIIAGMAIWLPLCHAHQYDQKNMARICDGTIVLLTPVSHIIRFGEVCGWQDW